jgi:hypothetical protein
VAERLKNEIRAVWDGVPLEAGSPQEDDDVEGQDRVPE